MKEQEQSSLTTLFLKVPRNIDISPESAKTFLAALTGISSPTLMQKMNGIKPQSLSLELITIHQQIRFAITASTELIPFVEAQLQSNYPLIVIEKFQDPLQNQSLEVKELTLKKGPYYPIAIYSSFSDIDPMSSILSVLSKAIENEITVVQIALQGTNSKWQGAAASFAEMGSRKEDGSYSPRGDAAIIKEKLLFPGFLTSIRVASNNKNSLAALVSSFGVFTRSDGNSIGKVKKGLFSLSRSNELRDLRLRRVNQGTILNIQEIATLWHLPGEKIKTSSIVWGYAVISDPPDSLPVASGKSDEEKQDINFFAKTMFKNKEQIFGLKTVDRFRHVWVVGKTGTGKSTLIANMVIDDIKKGRGVGVIDPHGELCETILNYIPSERINDTVYFNPADREYPIIINPLEVKNKEEAELVVSGIVAVFNKIFGFSWGPRLEYILRNVLLSLSVIPDTTLANVITALTNPAYRLWMIDQMKKHGGDPILLNFWENEFNKMQDKQREEAVAPILNKVGQFVTSPLIRRIIGQPKSSISIDDTMNQGKIILCNLSQGRLGEDNAALIGAMLITKFQLAAMRRVEIPEADRVNFFLYVDEFQNFATPSFMKILSEARKYRLSLMLANQYMAQIPEEVQKSILGNAGSLIAFTVGADDAAIIQKEFTGVFTEGDLVNLANRQVATRLMVDGHASRPFLAHTLPLPESANQQKEKILAVSRERYSKKLERMEDATAPLPDLTEFEAKAKQGSGGPKKSFGGGGGNWQQRPQGQYNNNQGYGGGYQGQRSQYSGNGGQSRYQHGQGASQPRPQSPQMNPISNPNPNPVHPSPHQQQPVHQVPQSGSKPQE